MEPVFIHDCADCEFFGTCQGKDMYVCPTGTKVVRYGNEGSEYVSGSSYTFRELLAMA